MTRPLPYDVAVAKQIAILTRLNLSVHIHRKGPASFRSVKPWYARKS